MHGVIKVIKYDLIMISQKNGKMVEKIMIFSDSKKFYQ